MKVSLGVHPWFVCYYLDDADGVLLRLEKELKENGNVFVGEIALDKVFTRRKMVKRV